MQALNSIFCAEATMSLNEEALLVRNMRAPTQSQSASAENECNPSFEGSVEVADFHVKCKFVYITYTSVYRVTTQLNINVANSTCIILLRIRKVFWYLIIK